MTTNKIEWICIECGETITEKNVLKKDIGGSVEINGIQYNDCFCKNCDSKFDYSTYY